MNKKILLLFTLVLFLFCSKNEDNGNDNLKKLTEKARKSGFKVEYNESLNIKKPDLNNITDPKTFGTAECGLNNDTAFINKLKKISNLKKNKIEN